MHDPNTVAFEIYLGKKKKSNGNYRTPLLTIWHKDPEADGTDDSCGWFMRTRHGNAEMLDRIKKAIDFEFDRIFKSDSGTLYYVGYFSPNTGMPNYSTQGIVLDMFSKAAWQFFNYDNMKYKKWMKDNLFEVLHFAENNTDSLKDEVTGTFRIGTGTEWKRQESLNHYASVIYEWLLRSNRKWYQHPRWHIHHWRFQLHPLQTLKRRYWDKCSVCGVRGFKGAAMGNWSGDEIWHEHCDKSSKPVAPNPPQAEMNLN